MSAFTAQKMGVELWTVVVSHSLKYCIIVQDHGVWCAQHRFCTKWNLDFTLLDQTCFKKR